MDRDFHMNLNRVPIILKDVFLGTLKESEDKGLA